jgi:hypothetical protein
MYSSEPDLAAWQERSRLNLLCTMDDQKSDVPGAGLHVARAPVDGANRSQATGMLQCRSSQQPTHYRLSQNLHQPRWATILDSVKVFLRRGEIEQCSLFLRVAIRRPYSLMSILKVHRHRLGDISPLVTSSS